MLVLRLANLALLALYPVAWVSPLATAGLLPWFEGSQVSILGGLGDLWQVDAGLAVLVALFAVVIPYCKTLTLVAVQFGWLGRKAMPAVEALGKLSMVEVFLVAVYIVVVKGVGLGHVTPAWGLWLFTACVLGQMWVAHATARLMAASRS
ncbi:paraquat-inducible protein A [Limibaculum sp. M0105]|uniref:Paraquat-inducible protein A n=1 Tax=Thermohalobaculum xanthum TaxID=2753746 RepID=A0A8J7S9U4_9RHOB|nr:paraquat-inducible protein A [Thermohalobaculum xanthum]MBK0397678.1 paraquat-inducible protein A [Thermohalobaculum xanthum]